jgi:DNA primase
MIGENVIAEILSRTDIVELIGSYLPLKAAGRTHKALCPFHNEKTPSFVVNPERQIFHCFGCGEGGDAITFLMKQDRMSFLEAVRYLASRAGVPLPVVRGEKGAGEGDGRLALYEVHRQALQHFRENLQGAEGAAARAYLAGRGLTAELIERFQLGYALPRWDGLLRALKKRGHPDKLLEATGLCLQRQKGTGLYDRFRHRLMIPIWDVSGKVVAFGGRALEANEVKYLNSPETVLYRKGAHLYALNVAARAIRERKVAIVVEGYFDAIMLHAHGFDHAVATLGTALTSEQARLLARYAETVVLLFDPDAPGIGAARRNLEHLVNVDLQWRVVLLPDGLDPDAFVRAHGAAAFGAALEGAKDLVEFYLDQRVSGLDLADPVQRARAVEALVEVVGVVDSPVRREGYLLSMAQRTGISDRALLEAVARRRSRGERRDAAPAPAPAPDLPPSAEEQLIFISLNYPAHREAIVRALTPEDIRDPILRRIFTGLLEAGGLAGSGGAPEGRTGLPPMSLLPEEVQRRLSSLMARTPDGEADASGVADTAVLAQTVEDCVARIQAQRARAGRTALRQALEAADREKDPARALQLLAEHPSVKGSQRNP